MVEDEDAAEDDAKAMHGVKIEAKFAVGEYNIVILSAQDSTGLDTYLREQHYQIPKGAEPLLRPYVESGMKFFVAKVDPQKVKFENGHAALSPLRFHYDADEFSLPIRLGIANSAGTQDLTINILAPDQRYEVANYPNVTIPTNLVVRDETRTRFGEFYAALFDRTVEQNPGAVVTEYAGAAGSCDPCPGPPLQPADFATLGADVLGAGFNGIYGFTLTRLHARYGKAGAPNDLVFKAAPPIVGGRENRDMTGGLEHGAAPSSTNNFQGRYAIRHAWTGPIACAAPKRGRWVGEPPAGQQIAGDGAPKSATNVAFAPRGQIALPDVVAQDIPELAVRPGVPLPGGASFSGKAQGCGCATTDHPTGGFALAGLTVLALRREGEAKRSPNEDRMTADRLWLASLVRRAVRAPRARGRVLRLLRRGRRPADVQRRDAGRAHAHGHAHRAGDAEQLQGTAAGLRDGDPGAGRAPRGRRQDARQRGLRARRADGRAAARRVLGAGSVRASSRTTTHDADGGGGWHRGQDLDVAERPRPRRHDRGAVRRRRVPDRDPVGEGLDRPRHAGCTIRATRSPTARARCCGRTSRAG